MAEEKKGRGKVLKVLLALVGLAGLFILYICFIGPFGEMPKAERVTIEKVADQENAWTEYNLAIQDLGDSQTVIKELPPMLETASRGQSNLEDLQKAYLDKH